MPEIDALAEVLGRAMRLPQQVQAYRGKLIVWRDPVLYETAFRRHRSKYASSYEAFDDPPRRAPATAPVEGYFSIECRLPQPPRITHISGDDRFGAPAVESAAGVEQGVLGSLGDGAIAAPLRLMTGCRLAIIGANSVAGRSTTQVQLAFRPSPLSTTSHLEWSGADRRVVDVEDEHGLALRCIDFLQESPIDAYTLTSLEVDPNLRDAEMSSRETDEVVAPASHPVSVDDAAELVSYALLVPARIPAGTQALCHVRQNDTLIQYVGSDGRIWLSITVEDAAKTPREDLARFEKVRVSGRNVHLWESPTGPWGRTVAITELEGSRARVHSPLDRQALLDIARSLEPHR